MPVKTLNCVCVALAILAISGGLAAAVEVPAAEGVDVDGDLAEWTGRAPAGEWDAAESIVWGEPKYSGGEDLGGRCWMGWDGRFLYVAAEVVDDAHRQTMTGEDLWKGDHTMLLVDADREGDRANPHFSNDDFQIGLSPGSFDASADFLFRRAPEAYVYRPQYVQGSGIVVAAKRAERGYTIEAAIPWSFLGVEPKEGHAIGFDVCPSDTDGEEAVQETLASLLPGKWTTTTTERMVEGRLAGTPAGAAPAKAVDVWREEVRLSPQSAQETAFAVPEGVEGLTPVLSLRARLVFDELAGCSHGMVVEVNGEPLGSERALDRPSSVTFASGHAVSLYMGSSWTAFYSPDYRVIHSDEASTYYIPPGAFDAYRFSFDLQGLLKPGENTLAIRYRPHDTVTAPLAFERVAVRWVAPDELDRLRIQEAVSARGPVVVRPPAPLAPAEASLAEGGGISAQGSKALWRIDSEFSEPGGEWRSLGWDPDGGWESVERVSASELRARTARFEFTRTLVPMGECVEVRDTFVNRTQAPQPVMVRHVVDWPAERVKKLVANGRDLALKRGIAQNSMNPTLLVCDETAGLGLVCVDDAFRLHGRQFCTDGKAGLADGELVLAPGARYEQVWQIYDVPSADYWDFVNAVRRSWDVNFRIDGSFAFVDPRSGENGQLDLSADAMRDWLEKRDALFPTVMIYHTRTKQALHGLEFAPEGEYLADLQRLIATIREAKPDARVGHYFHCFINGASAASQVDPKDYLLDASGGRVYYGGDKNWELLVPTDGNRWGNQMFEQLKMMVGTFKLDGVYWDEQQYSYQQYHYAEPWDGVSGDIDANSHELLRKKSHVALLSARVRRNMAQWLLNHDLWLICNSSPMTRTEMQFKVPRFTETGSATNLLDTHLFTPIGLADHLTERTHADTIKGQLQFLDYGCLYYYYPPLVKVENSGLTRWMYPITPVAIGPGWILGKERILTTRPGRFTWGDAALPEVEVHVIDGDGKEVSPTFTKTGEDGVEWLDLQLPRGHAAAIVRR